ncbi:ATP-dependent RNA helicase ddx24 [Homalodisca vitripennis]|nr:ATP-dependent RNA helicase ddx24 [Homalodisca vitripennis]
MVKVRKSNLGWTPVQLNEGILAGGIEGLIGIEELTEQTVYKLERNDDLPSKERRKKSKIKLHKPMKSSSKRCSKHNMAKKTKFKVESTINETIDINSNEDHVGKVMPALISTPTFSDENCSMPGKEETNLDTLSWSSLFVPAPVVKALMELGFKEPTEIQRLSIPPAIKGRRDILGAAETGSGKTLAFGIPIIDGILNGVNNESNTTDGEDSASESDQEDEDIDGLGCVRVINLGKADKTHQQRPAQKLWALILTPTRELAVQVKDHLVAALKYTDIKVVALVGGMSMQKQQRLLKRQPHIVIATPGRLWELISQGEPHLSNIEDIRYLAIDETDRMTEVNHFPELRSLLERINIDPVKQKQRQNFVFSATLTLVHDLPLHTKLKNKKKNKKKELVLSSSDKLKKLVNLIGMTNPKIIDVTKKTGTSELLTESSIVCSLDQKDYYLYYFLVRHPGRTLVFCNSISCVRRMASLLSLLGVRPLPLHANMLQKQRLKNLERFRDSPDGLLLATDVAARGLDIPNVQHVIHYQVPRTSETYVHRSGRTARANNEGLTLMLIETAEQKLYLRLMRTLNREKDLPRFPIVSGLMEAVKLRVNLAREIDGMQLEYKRATSKVSWVQKAAEEMDLLLDEDEMPDKVNDRTSAIIKRKIEVKMKQLKMLLKKSLTNHTFSYIYPSLNNAVENFKSEQSAIEAVRSATEDNQKKRKRRNQRPFRSKKKKPSASNTE